MLQWNGCGYLDRYNLDDFRLWFESEKLIFYPILGKQGQFWKQQINLYWLTEPALITESKWIIEFYPKLIVAFFEEYDNTHPWVHKQN